MKEPDKKFVFLSNYVDEKLAFLAFLLLQSYKNVFNMKSVKRLFQLKKRDARRKEKFLEDF